jgi:hypothetical protein
MDLIKRGPTVFGDLLWGMFAGPVRALFFGVALAGVMALWSAPAGEAVPGGQLTPLVDVKPSPQPWVSPPIDTPIEGSTQAHVTVFAKTVEPPTAAAVVTLYGSQNGTDDTEIAQFKAEGASWSHWTAAASHPKLRIKVESPLPGNGDAVSRADLYVYVSPSPVECTGFSLCQLRELPGRVRQFFSGLEAGAGANPGSPPAT